MSIKSEMENFREPDVWSLVLFVLAQMKEIPEYSAVSELAFVLDKKNLIRLCEYFGGLTITVPKIEELESVIYGLLMYQYREIKKLSFDEAARLMPNDRIAISDIEKSYQKIKEVLKNYSFETRSKE